ncbi:MAG: hypothetical protein WBN06_12025 [Lysobacterales bacterium]
MKWLQDNPLGMVLAATCGLFALLALAMAIVWNLPVSVETAGVEAEIATGNDAGLTARQVGTLGDYKVINEKPVFNESRQPVMVELDEDISDDDTTEIKDAPDVRLTGVVITSTMKIASLTPADTNLETVRAHEGDALTGEFLGWQVTAVNPRTVVLESRDGQSLELDLQVHDVKIQEPPTPVAPAATTQAGSGEGGGGVDEDDAPLSRAEQIRQRIAERREELRLEQEQQQSQNGTRASTAKQAAKPSEYQSAIRAMMKNKSKDKGSDDEKDR